jgi:type I restriction enzyme, S subunit
MGSRKVSVEFNLDLIGRFPVDWERSTLERACSLVTDGTHDSPKMATTGFPLVTGKCITGGRLNLNTAYLISERDHRAVVSRSKPEFGDILFTNIGNSIGELARVETEVEFSIKNVALFKPSSRLDGQFLKYYLNSSPVQSYIRGTTLGSAQPFIGLGTLRAFPVPLPPLPEQRAIAHILGTLDDKIELNRKRNETLEDMARALFKDWFVDFGPVRAKIDGRDPYLPAEIWDLFPDRLDDEGKPEGWDIAKVEAMLTRLSAKVRYTKDQVTSYGKVPVFEQGASIFLGFHDRDAIYNASPNDPAFVFGDHTCITKLSCQPFDISQNVIPLRGRGRPTMWVYYAIKEKQKFEEYRRHWMELITKDIIVAPSDICWEFSKKAAIIHVQIEQSESESRNLAQLRDTLLPKLISGELRVGDVDISNKKYTYE